MRAPRWTKEEFELLLSRPDLTNDGLAQFIQTRSSGAIAVVRSGVCSYHRTGEHFGSLPKMMRDRIERPPRAFTCHECGWAIGPS